MMLTENQIVDYVSKHLSDNGYVVQQQLSTLQTGIDIIAIGPNNKQCFVEAKGATSSKLGTSRYGIEFNRSQIKTHIGVALVMTFKLMQSNPEAEVIIALPNNFGHREIIESMSTVIAKTGVILMFVNLDGTVEKYL